MKLSLLISDDCALLYENNNVKRFTHAERKELSAHLMSYGASTISVFVDSIDETHLVERTPVMTVFDAGALHKRLLKKHFKRSNRAFSVMDKNHHVTKKNQKQSKHVLSGFSNPSDLNDWIKAIQQTKCLLAGIYSLPLALPLLFKDLGVSTRYSLVVYKNNNDVYRHAFFDGEYLEFSRVVRNVSGDTDDDVTANLTETLMFIQERTKGFSISIHFLGGANVPSAILQKIDNDAIRALNVSDIEIHEHQFNTADQFILDKLKTNKKLTNHYATQEELSDLNTAFVGKWLWRLVWVAFCLALTLSLFFFYQIKSSQTEQEQLDAETRKLIQLYEEKTSARKHADIDPRQIAKSVQQIECIQAKEFRSPKYALLQISESLMKYDTVAPIKIEWENKQDDLLSCINEEQNKKSDKQKNAHTFDVVLVAKILSPNLTPRQINDLVDNMAKDFSEKPWVTNVKILSTPYSFDSSKSITMTGDNKANGDIQFSLKVSGR